MPYPKVSIIWLNHNSSNFMDLALESLQSVFDLDYPCEKLELIVVDNGSIDGSFEEIKSFVDRKAGCMRVKIIPLSKNLGFTGGVNVGFSARDRESKYVILLNNDAVAYSHSLRELVEFAENYECVAALQGIIVKPSGHIDTAGDFITETLESIQYLEGKPPGEAPKKPLTVTYADGSYVMYRVEAIRKCIGEYPFIWEMFAYGDDNFIGLMLWTCGYASISIPCIVAKHYRGTTLRRGKYSVFSYYFSQRNRIAISMVSNSRYRDVIPLKIIADTSKAVVMHRYPRRILATLYRIIEDGLKLGEKLRKRGIWIDIYRAPIVRIKPHELFASMILPGRILRYYSRAKTIIENFDIEEFRGCKIY